MPKKAPDPPSYHVILAFKVHSVQQYSPKVIKKQKKKEKACVEWTQTVNTNK